jgi:hypothetical protein
MNFLDRNKDGKITEEGLIYFIIYSNNILLK